MTPVLLAIGSVLALLGAIAAIRALGQRWHWTAEVQRKCVHVMVGLFAMALPALFADRRIVVLLVLLALAVMLALRLFPRILGGAGAAIHSVERKSFGDVWLAVSIGFLFLRSEGVYILYGLPLAIITLSDAAAALTGSAYGRRRFATEGGVKSWEGVVAFFMVGWIAAMAILLLFSETPRGNVIVLGAIIAAFGAMVEAVSWRGLDNLFVPLAIHFFLRGFLFAGLAELALIAVPFFAACFAAPGLSGWLRLSPSTMRAFVVALFVFLGMGDLFGTVVPLFAMATYLLSRRVLPGGGAHPDLDFLGTLCATALIWLFAGETMGPTAIHHYNLTMAGIALGYGLLALGGRTAAALALAVVANAAFCAFAFNAPHPWPPAPAFAWVASASLALVTFAALSFPDLFRRWRASRLALVASLIPLGAYFQPWVIA